MPLKNSRPAILVVDDEPVILHLITTSLEGEGFAVTSVLDPAAGLREFERGTFDAVISDRCMPAMSGEEFAGAIKARSPSTPVLLISGHHPCSIDVTRIDAFLPKPFTRSQLLAALLDLLPVGTR